MINHVVDMDMNENQILSLIIDNVDSLPDTTYIGKIIYFENKLYIYKDTGWEFLESSSSPCITDIDIDSNDHLIATFSDGNIIDAGKLTLDDDQKTIYSFLFYLLSKFKVIDSDNNITMYSLFEYMALHNNILDGNQYLVLNNDTVGDSSNTLEIIYPDPVYVASDSKIVINYKCNKNINISSFIKFRFTSDTDTYVGTDIAYNNQNFVPSDNLYSSLTIPISVSDIGFDAGYYFGMISVQGFDDDTEIIINTVMIYSENKDISTDTASDENEETPVE